MGLLSSLNNAVSGLNVNQQNLSVLSQNIANANTAGYSTQTANQAASFIDGLPQGVTIASITRSVNEFLNAQVRTQNADSSASTITQSYYQQVENLLGQPGGTNSVDQNVNAFFTAVQDMANTPSTTAQTTVVNAATTLASQVSSLATSVQNLRLQADTQIGNDVSSVNTDLKKLHSLNTSIEQAYATGENQSGLLDSRDSTLQDLSQYMSITTLINKDGTVNVNTGSGQTLVGGNLTQLSYTQASAVQTFENNGTLSPLQLISYNTNGTPTGNPINLVTSGQSGTNGSDSTITSNITGGQIGALVQVRDKVLPQVLGQLDELASSVRDQVNAVNNAGTSYPTPNSYTGERLVAGNQVSQYSGSIQIAALNADGSPIASAYADEPNGMAPLNLDLSTLNTGNGPGNVSTDGLINAVNQYFKQPQPKLEMGNINNVQLALDSNTVPANGNQLNFDFSLNNISNNSGSFLVSGATVLDSNGNVVGTSTSNAPTVAITNYQTQQGSTALTVNGTNTLANGDLVYIPPGSASASVGGIQESQIGGYYQVSNVTGGSFQITLASAASTNDSQVVSTTATTSSATVAAGQTMRTTAAGMISTNITNPLSTNSPYYTVQANVATVDASGNIVTSTVSYRVGASNGGAQNTLYGASSQTGGGTIVQPTNGTGTILTASLVDANGAAIAKVNGSYGVKQGYLKIAAINSSVGVAINEGDSKQLGTPGPNGGLVAGTNQGFSQYFGLNNFFTMNQATPTGDTVAGSALNFAVTSNIANNPSNISTGTLSQSAQPTDSTLPANYTYRVNSGDNSVAQQLAGLSTQSVNFAAAGGLPKIGTTLSQYGGLIIAQTSTNLTNASNTATDSQTLLNGFTTQAQNKSGVNLDQQLANTVIYQNAYTASTRVITVVSQLFQDLLSIIQ